MGGLGGARFYSTQRREDAKAQRGRVVFMFRTFARTFLPNPLDWMLKRTAKRGGKRILIAWNRGLGDIALGLYAMVQRVREFIPDAKIVFLTRENLRDGFSLLEGVETVVASSLKRGEPVDVQGALSELGIDQKDFDLIIKKPSPTDWVRWQRGKVVPRLKWKNEYDSLWKKFDLAEPYVYIGVQAVAETTYGLWRNWPLERWKELFDRFEKRGNVRVILFGFGDVPQFSHSSIVDLRGKTTLFEMLSIIKNRCHSLILPDSGILSMSYYLDASFPIRVVSLWGDPKHGILKQAVSSPNPQLVTYSFDWGAEGPFDRFRGSCRPLSVSQKAFKQLQAHRGNREKAGGECGLHHFGGRPGDKTRNQRSERDFLGRRQKPFSMDLRKSGKQTFACGRDDISFEP